MCLRPAYLYEGVESPLRNQAAGSIDMLVFRENTEGEYANVGGRLYPHSSHDIAIQTSVFTRRGCERIIRAAFEQAGCAPFVYLVKGKPVALSYWQVPPDLFEDSDQLGQWAQKAYQVALRAQELKRAAQSKKTILFQ